ncbi:hypothetical protein [Ramlibacter sp. AN1133]|uniref:hypothetical protein n=1 Tax=Ramlibacter sp. AN1133 TaxID=3133429 RepID=UPI0030BCF367
MSAPKTTPAAQWRAAGEPDPHGDRYDCERAQLTMGELSDDELANEVFLHGNAGPDPMDLLTGKALPSIAYLTAGKDRIRWLSRALERERARARQAPGARAEMGNRHDDVTRHAVDTVMRVAHNLRRDGCGRALTAPEYALIAGDDRLRRAGWNWGPDGPVPPGTAAAPQSTDLREEALDAADEALGVLLHDAPAGEFSLQRAAWGQVRAALGLPVLRDPNAAGAAAAGDVPDPVRELAGHMRQHVPDLDIEQSKRAATVALTLLAQEPQDSLPRAPHSDGYATSGPLLELDALLSALVSAVLQHAHSGEAEDLAGVKQVKAIQRHVRVMIAAGPAAGLCSACQGTGRQGQADGMFHPPEEGTCPECNGTGRA